MLDSNQHREAYIQSVCEGLERVMIEMGTGNHGVSAMDAFLIMQISAEIEYRFGLAHQTGWDGFEDEFSDITDMARELSPTIRCAVLFGGQIWE